MHKSKWRKQQKGIFLKKRPLPFSCFHTPHLPSCNRVVAVVHFIFLLFLQKPQIKKEEKEKKKKSVKKRSISREGKLKDKRKGLLKVPSVLSKNRVVEFLYKEIYMI